MVALQQSEQKRLEITDELSTFNPNVHEYDETGSNRRNTIFLLYDCTPDVGTLIFFECCSSYSSSVSTPSL